MGFCDYDLSSSISDGRVAAGEIVFGASVPEREATPAPQLVPAFLRELAIEVMAGVIVGLILRLL
jgi:hypothetical protein